MRKTLGLVLLGLAAFLVTAALLAALYVPGQIKKTPLDIDSQTRLSGTARTVPVGDGGPIKALSHTVANGELSDSDVVVFDTFTCLVRDDGTVEDCTDDDEAGSALITASTDTFATDRRTAMAIQDEAYVSAESQHEGLVNKFPFDVQQETYPFWDGVLGRTIDAAFQGEEDIDGLRTYKFLTEVDDETAEIAAGIEGTYSSLKTMWIDPVTGTLIKQQEQQSRFTGDGTPVLQMVLGFTDETVAANVESTKATVSQLGLLSTVPWILGLLGLVLLGLGGYLVSSSATAPRHAEDDAYPVEDAPEATYQERYPDRTEQFFEEATATDATQPIETRRAQRDIVE